MLTVTTPADDPWLITIEQARVAAGLEEDDDSQDAVLDVMRATVSAQIFDACNIAVGNGAPPTLRRETLTEVIRSRGYEPLILSRRHEVSIVSIEGWAGGSDPASLDVEAERGIIRSRTSGFSGQCGYGRVTVVYEAGFDEVPPVLASAAADMIRVRRSEAIRDPLVKKQVVDVDGVDRVETEFWVTAAGASSQTSPVPALVEATLKRFKNSVMR